MNISVSIHPKVLFNLVAYTICAAAIASVAKYMYNKATEKKEAEVTVETNVTIEEEPDDETSDS